jgi:glycine/D-amino acid oxidase-like deaminating enzyme
MTVPTSSQYVVVGAGLHGFSTAYPLTHELRARSPARALMLVLDKGRPARARPASRAASSATTTSARDERADASVRRGVESDPAAYA